MCRRRLLTETVTIKAKSLRITQHFDVGSEKDRRFLNTTTSPLTFIEIQFRHRQWGPAALGRRKRFWRSAMFESLHSRSRRVSISRISLNGGSPPTYFHGDDERGISSLPCQSKRSRLESCEDLRLQWQFRFVQDCAPPMSAPSKRRVQQNWGKDLREEMGPL